MTRTALISRRVVFAEDVRPACVLIDPASGKIIGIAEADSPDLSGDCRCVDLGEEVLLPGLVDTHVHLNEPGRTEWEGFATGTRAAAAGGVTTVVDMPLNCLPETTTVAALDQKRAAAAGQCTVDWRAWGGAVNGNAGHLAPLAQAGVPGFKCFLLYPGCDGFGPIDEPDLRLAMPIIAHTGLPLLVHAELAESCAKATQALASADWRQYATYLQSRPDEAELRAIERMISLAGETGCWVHIVHLSSALALPMLRRARAEGVRLTVETCPHYLFFAGEQIPEGETWLKCAPPIRSSANRELLWEGLRDGTIDLIASDHSPCPPGMKQRGGSFAAAWGGIASLSLGVSVVWTTCAARGFSLSDLARWMSTNPSRLAGLAAVKGRIAPGFDADLAVLSPERAFVVTKEHLPFRHPVSPYLGQTLHGIVRETYLRGVKVFTDRAFPGAPLGREVAP